MPETWLSSSSKKTILEKAITAVYESLGMEPDFGKSISFEQFIQYLIKTKDADLDPHWRPQHSFLGLGLFKFKYDFVGQFEKLDEVIELLETKFDIKVNTNVARKSHQTKYRDIDSNENFSQKYPEDFLDLDGFPDSNQFYTPELEELVRKRYAEDIDLYEREFIVNPKP